MRASKIGANRFDMDCTVPSVLLLFTMEYAILITVIYYKY